MQRKEKERATEREAYAIGVVVGQVNANAAVHLPEFSIIRQKTSLLMVGHFKHHL